MPYQSVSLLNLTGVNTKLKMVQKGCELDAIKLFDMKKQSLTIAAVFISLSLCSQTKNDNSLSFSDTVEKYFDYAKLRQVSCIEVPAGIYSVSFRVGKHNLPHDFQSSNQSLTSLNELMINAIKTSAGKVVLKKKKVKYLLLFYFNTILGCNSSGDTTKVSDNLYSEVSKILGRQLYSVDTSLKRLIKKENNYYVLQPVSIDDNNPAITIKSSGGGFKNCIGQRVLTKQEVEAMEKMIQELRQKKGEN